MSRQPISAPSFPNYDLNDPTATPEVRRVLEILSKNPKYQPTEDEYNAMANHFRPQILGMKYTRSPKEWDEARTLDEQMDELLQFDQPPRERSCAGLMVIETPWSLARAERKKKIAEEKERMAAEKKGLRSFKV